MRKSEFVCLRDKDSTDAKGKHLVYSVKVSSKSAYVKNPVTRTKQVIFGKINGKGTEFAFKIPTRFTILKKCRR